MKNKKIKMLKNLHNEGFDLTKDKIYEGAYDDGEKYLLYDDCFRRVGLAKIDEGIVFEVMKEKYEWTEKYEHILKQMGFISYNGITYYKEYGVETNECCFSIILIPNERDGCNRNICVLDFYSDEEMSYDVMLSNKMTCELYRDVTLLIMNDIIDVDFTIKEKCFVGRE